MNKPKSSQTFELTLPSYVIATIRELEQGGFEAWCVGGCVRDAILGRPINDYDIATSATWQETERTLSQAGFAIHRTGTKHGTVTASIDGHAMEITTYRADGAYSDGRHPDSVDFVNSIEEDLARRDFTINAMAYHPSRGLIDFWGGAEDLQKSTIRVVGEGRKRFSEDALRILRACRFCSQLGFSIEPDTMQSMLENKMRILNVSTERITHELQEMLLGPHVHDALIACVDVLGAVMPELAACKGFDQHTPYHVYDVLEHTAWVVQRMPATPLARWAALFHDLGKPGACFMDGDRAHFYGHPRLSEILARDIMERLCLAPKFKAKVLTMVRMHDRTIPATSRAVKRTLANMDGDTELFRTLCQLKRADARAQSHLSEPRLELAQDLERILDEVIAEQAAFSVRQLAIDGNDVLALGIPAGPAVGSALADALDAVIDEQIKNDRGELERFLSGQLAKYVS